MLWDVWIVDCQVSRVFAKNVSRSQWKQLKRCNRKLLLFRVPVGFVSAIFSSLDD